MMDIEDEQAESTASHPTKKYKNWVMSAVIAIVLIGGAVFIKTTMAAENTDSAKQAFTLKELATFDGKSDHECYVAVDGTVYKIEQGRLWQNGQHTSSEGEASCGRDLSQAITQSPHGKSKLSTLEVVGTLKN